MTRFSALLDACVLVPIALTDTLLRLAEAGLYRPLWSTAILDEMVEAIEEIHPDLRPGRARHRADQMQGAFEDATVTGWEPLLAGIDLPDPDDRHVVAAAQRGRADVIVTANLSDFPEPILNALDIEIQSPDEFLLNQLDLDAGRTMRVLHEQASATRIPSITVEELLRHLARCGVPEFSEAARGQLWRIPRPR
ncbi:PIN domain-containing protein [Raineyella sp. W15-4]|uniref:PIN domain-containing protein n=1 Tax=Raineyella sp. W15-4 TaxID=3081651 RepID=UPI0029554260|nr:PIN domain-containing protein [Raineyella sp. W15-4]WOQ17868.1 PIN domain-containing protein [Raineyella sp. W15-4]